MTGSACPPSKPTLVVRWWARRFAPLPTLRCCQQPREREFVAVGIGDVEITLAPFGIARHRGGLKSRCERAIVESIHVFDIEDDAPPPRPAHVIGLRDQVEIARPGAKGGEVGRLAAAGEIK